MASLVWPSPAPYSNIGGAGHARLLVHDRQWWLQFISWCFCFFCSYLSEEFSRMSEEDRDMIDNEAQELIKKTSEYFHSLKQLRKSSSAPKAILTPMSYLIDHLII